MPVHHSANWLNLVSISSPVGTQIPQAVGSAYAAKVLGKDDVSMVYFGEGTSSTGEFHVGLNFAGVWKAPCVFICRNNGWAISVPREKQTAAKTFASKAVGYGMPGIRVDGNDILAVLQVAQEAIDRARAGDGPTLIEALTYRVQGHSSSDDPSVYRDPKEPEIWEKRDPLNRLRNYLTHRGLWDRGLGAGPDRSLQPGDHRRAGRLRRDPAAAGRDDLRRRLRGAALAPPRAEGLADGPGSHQVPPPPRLSGEHPCPS
jgi:pyruvate dehydrogenase E1 component alpha subunit